MTHYSAPGKLFISGEWAILEVGNHGLVAAVNNRVHVTIAKKSDDISITATDFNIHNAKAHFDGDKIVFINLDKKSKETLKLLSVALEMAVKFSKEKGLNARPFSVSNSSKETRIEVDGEVKKIGFGSSAALVVAAITAVLDFFGYSPKKEEIYKLSAISHYYAQGKIGSAFDVAASTYGGLFVYSRFDPEWLTAKMESEESLSNIINEQWPSLIIKPLTIPKGFCLLVAWTKESASTSVMVKQMNEFKKNNRKEYDRLYNEIARTAKNVISAFTSGKKHDFFSNLKNNEILLKELGVKSGVPIVTKELELLAKTANKYTAGKLSGAGGGDCGIAICFDDETAEKIVAEWKRLRIYPLDVTIDKEGVRKE